MKEYGSIKELIEVINAYSTKGTFVVDVWTENLYAVLQLNTGIKIKMII